MSMLTYLLLELWVVYPLWVKEWIILLEKIHYLLQLHLRKYEHAYLPPIGTVGGPSSVGERMDDIIGLDSLSSTSSSPNIDFPLKYKY